MKIAAWSGPRNLSTAMMYAFAARGDCQVLDEPFYAAYLARTGLDHPMREDVLATQSTDPERAAERLGEAASGAKPHLYVKLMAHHMADDWSLDWASGWTHVHLIRHPARVVASYAAKRENPTLDDLGYVQQAHLFERIGGVVIDTTEIRADPPTALAALCLAIELPYDPAMLTWPAGGRPEDGVWASHWYGAVHRSTGFAGAEGPLPVLDGAAQDLVRAALPHYQQLARDAVGDAGRGLDTSIGDIS